MNSDIFDIARLPHGLRVIPYNGGKSIPFSLMEDKETIRPNRLAIADSLGVDQWQYESKVDREVERLTRERVEYALHDDILKHRNESGMLLVSNGRVWFELHVPSWKNSSKDSPVSLGQFHKSGYPNGRTITAIHMKGTVRWPRPVPDTHNLIAQSRIARIVEGFAPGKFRVAAKREVGLLCYRWEGNTRVWLTRFKDILKHNPAHSVFTNGAVRAYRAFALDCDDAGGVMLMQVRSGQARIVTHGRNHIRRVRDGIRIELEYARVNEYVRSRTTPQVRFDTHSDEVWRNAMATAWAVADRARQRTYQAVGESVEISKGGTRTYKCESKFFTKSFVHAFLPEDVEELRKVGFAVRLPHRNSDGQRSITGFGSKWQEALDGAEDWVDSKQGKQPRFPEQDRWKLRRWLHGQDEAQSDVGVSLLHVDPQGNPHEHTLWLSTLHSQPLPRECQQLPKGVPVQPWWDTPLVKFS